MNETGWDRIVDAIDEKYGIDEHGNSKQPVPDKPELTQSVRFITFRKGSQNYRLEEVVGPAIVDRKSIYHRAAGSSVRFENVYDPDETQRKLSAFRDLNGVWEPISIEELAG
jgi:hypothetical protein